MMGQPSRKGGIGATGTASGDVSPLCLGWRTQQEMRLERAPMALLPPPLLLTAATTAKCMATLQAWGCCLHMVLLPVPSNAREHRNSAVEVAQEEQ